MYVCMHDMTMKSEKCKQAHLHLIRFLLRSVYLPPPHHRARGESQLKHKGKKDKSINEMLYTYDFLDIIYMKELMMNKERTCARFSFF